MLVINGVEVEVPGVESKSFLDDPIYGFTDPKDWSYRTTGWVRSICVHTRMGMWPQKLVTGGLNSRWDDVVAKRVSKDNRHASWHISIADDTFVCHLDLALVKAYHASQANEVSIGIEMFQDSKGRISELTLETAVKVIDVITREFGIQRQIPVERTISRRFARDKKGWKRHQKLAYVRGGLAGKDYVGVWGHRNGTRNRGQGDPGDMIFHHLENAGYEKYQVGQDMDKEAWKTRQRNLALRQDGVPGPKTVRALKKAGYENGIWVPRPSDY